MPSREGDFPIDICAQRFLNESELSEYSDYDECVWILIICYYEIFSYLNFIEKKELEIQKGIRKATFDNKEELDDFYNSLKESEQLRKDY